MSNAEFATSESVNLTDSDRLNIILKYMEYNAKLSILKAIADPERVQFYRASASALAAMLELSKSDEHIMRMECELQTYEGSPVWDIKLP